MLSSMAEALGINGTFFVQFVIFLIFYPVLSRWLFKPYFEQEQKREQETVQRLQKADHLKEKKQVLEKEYEEKARQLDKEFNQLYNQENQNLKETFLRQKSQKQAHIKKEYQEKTKAFLQEIKQAQQDMQAEVEPLSKALVKRLL